MIKNPRFSSQISFALAILLHVVLFLAGGTVFYQPAEYGVQSGIASVDVELMVAPAPEAKPAEAEALPDVPAPDAVFAETPAPPKPAAPAAASVPSIGSDGAVWAEPNYLSNRPPRSPRAALLANVEGTVLLLAEIDEKGAPVSVKIERSSGAQSLDESALRAVRQWKFNPAHIGSVPVRSKSRIPVAFKIDDAQQ